jgi:zinc transport system substrate-binding protein
MNWRLMGLMACLVAATAGAEPLRVVVSIPPQAEFVRRVAGDRATVEVLLPPGQNHESFSPTAPQMARLAQAQVYFRVGLSFETVLAPRLAKAFPTLRQVDTSQGITKRAFREAEVADEHAHHADGEGDQVDQADEDDHAGHDHAAGGLDPHIWLSPPLIAHQAATIAAALTELDPAGKDAYAANLAAYQAELAALHTELQGVLAPLKGRKVYVFHPAYGYFTDAYGLVQVPVEIAGKEPTARQLAKLVDQAKADGVKVIFVQPQFSQRSAQTVAAALGGVVAPLDPLAADMPANLRAMARQIRQALQ